MYWYVYCRVKWVIIRHEISSAKWRITSIFKLIWSIWLKTEVVTMPPQLSLTCGYDVTTDVYWRNAKKKTRLGKMCTVVVLVYTHAHTHPHTLHHHSRVDFRSIWKLVTKSWLNVSELQDNIAWRIVSPRVIPLPPPPLRSTTKKEEGKNTTPKFNVKYNVQYLREWFCL